MSPTPAILHASYALDLLTIDGDLAEQAGADLVDFDHRRGRITGVDTAELKTIAEASDGLGLHQGGRHAGFIRTVHDQDEALTASVLLENLVAGPFSLLDFRGRSATPSPQV